jgi:hypothetical protein
MIVLIIVGAACALVGTIVGSCINSSSASSIEPISPYSRYYEENRDLQFKIGRLESDNTRLRMEAHSFRSMSHAWNHCCPNCYSEHTHVLYAKSPREQEVADLLSKVTVPMDELKKKFGVK